MAVDAIDIPAKAYGCTSIWLVSCGEADEKAGLTEEQRQERTFMPNNPAIRAPVPIPIVPMETYEEGRGGLAFRSSKAISFTFRSSARSAFRFESSISSTISWVDWTLPFGDRDTCVG
jgi:hypothetical protein